MEEPKPCPFCGAPGDVWSRDVVCGLHDVVREENMVAVIVEEYVEEETRWVADCSGCDCVIGEHFKTKEEAIAAWNKRV